jgi:hypothetical protein
VIEMVKNVLYLASGVAIGYYVAHRRLERYFDERLEREIEDVKEFERLKYQRKAAKDYVQDPEFFEAAVKAAESLKIYEGATIGPAVMTQEMTEADLRDEEQAAEAAEAEDEEESEEDLEDEPDTAFEDPVTKVAPPVLIVPEQATGSVNYNRISTAPKEGSPEAKEVEYVPEVIPMGEFVNNDSGFEQITMTYYIADDRLANIYDQVFTEDDRQADLSPETFELLKSPEARGGANTVYIRNDLRQKEFEIIVSRGAYSDEVGEVVYATG